MPQICTNKELKQNWRANDVAKRKQKKGSGRLEEYTFEGGHVVMKLQLREFSMRVIEDSCPSIYINMYVCTRVL